MMKRMSLLLIIGMIITIWVSSANANTVHADYIPTNLESDPRLAYNPEDNQFLHVYFDQYLQLKGELIDADGTVLSEVANEYFLLSSSSPNQFDVAYSPTTDRYLLVWGKHEEINEENYNVLTGIWLDNDGSVPPDASPFDIYSDIASGSIPYSPTIAYDSQHDQFVVAYNIYSEGVNYLGTTLVNPAQVQQQYSLDVQTFAACNEFEECDDVSDVEIIFDDSADRYFLAWIGTDSNLVYGRYIHWELNDNEWVFYEGSPIDIGDVEGYRLELAYDSVNDKTAILWDTWGTDEEWELTVTAVTYGESVPPASIPIATIPSYESYYDFDISFDAATERFAAVWEVYDEEMDDYVLKGAYLADESLQVTESFSRMGSSYIQYMDPIVVNNPDLGNFLLAYATDEYGIEITEFGVEPEPHFIYPTMSYNPYSDQYLVVAADGINGISASILSRDGSLVNTISLYEYGIEEIDSVYSVDCCVNQDFLVVWSGLIDGYSQVMGLFINSVGQPVGESFVIASDAYSPVVKYDPSSGRYAVAYIHEDNNTVTVEAVSVASSVNISDPVVLGATTGEFANIQLFQPLQLEYDSGHRMMFAAWQSIDDDFLIKARYLNWNSEVSAYTAFEEELTVGESPLDEIEMNLKITYDATAQSMHVLWNSFSNSNFMIHHTEINPEGGISEIESKELGDLSDFFNHLIFYNPQMQQVVAVTLQGRDVDLPIIQLQSLDSFMKDDEAFLEWEIGDDSIVQLWDYSFMTAEYNSVSDRMAMFYSIVSDYELLEYGLIEFLSVEHALKQVDGNSDNKINVADVVKFIQQDQLSDVGQIGELLQYVETVYDLAEVET